MSRAKTGGRSKGTPNKKTTVLFKVLEQKGWEYSDEFIRLYRSANESVRWDMLKTLLPYSFAKFKEIDTSIADMEELANSENPDTQKEDVSTDNLVSIVNSQKN